MRFWCFDQIQAASVQYRIAIGPHAGRKALTLYSVPPLEEEPGIPLLARWYGFSLHAATVCETHQRSKLERLCRYITRPPAQVRARLRVWRSQKSGRAEPLRVATKRLSVDDHGRVVYRYKRPFRDGSTHVILEPVDFIARLAALVPGPRLNLTRFHSAGGIEVTTLAQPKKWPSEAVARAGGIEVTTLAQPKKWPSGAVGQAVEAVRLSRSERSADGTPSPVRVFAPNFKHRHRIVPRQPQGKVDSDKPAAPMTWAQRLKRVAPDGDGYGFREAKAVP